MTLHAIAPAPETRSGLTTDLDLAMGQLGPQGIAEQWLLRECGDRHWAMLAAAMGQDRAEFADAQGRPVYAAFCATSLKLTAPPGPLLCARASLRSDIYGLGALQAGSVHELRVPSGLVARLEMISTFVSRDGSGSNRRILRNGPVRSADLPPATPVLVDLAARARAVARAARQETTHGPRLLEVTPSPALDFNAVGLLYFPSFSRLAEEAEWAAGLAGAPLVDRDVVYLGNIDIGESLALEAAEGGLTVRRGDGRAVARVRTRRAARVACALA
ncbi:MAG: Pnap_2097 family protein [Pseudomonadota bacterium]